MWQNSPTLGLSAAHKARREQAQSPTDAEDLAYLAWLEQQDGYADYVAKVDAEAYGHWALDRDADGEDSSEEAYADYLDSLLPTD